MIALKSEKKTKKPANLKGEQNIMEKTYFENKKFESICKLSQARLKKYVEKALKETHNDITSGDGFVFAKGTFHDYHLRP